MSSPINSKPIAIPESLYHEINFPRCYQCFKKQKIHIRLLEGQGRKINLCSMECMNNYKGFNSAMKELRNGDESKKIEILKKKRNGE